METKTFEIRDVGTFIPMVGILMAGGPFHPTLTGRVRDEPLLRRAGYGAHSRLVLFTRLDGGGKAHHDPYAWGDRTYSTAHNYITENWDKLESGALIDVEFILGETKQPKESELDASPWSREPRANSF